MPDNDWRAALGALLPDDYKPEQTPADDTPTRPRPTLTITIDRKRAGKTATIVSGFDVDDPELGTVAATLRRQLGTGGSARGGEILIQGDRANDVRQQLTLMGYKLRR